MKLSQKNIDQVKNGFAKMQSREDLLALLSRANKLIHEEKADDFQLKSLTYYSNPKIATNRYKTFSINKKSEVNELFTRRLKD
jgi:glycine cleavage system regulatory protein